MKIEFTLSNRLLVFGITRSKFECAVALQFPDVDKKKIYIDEIMEPHDRR